MFTRATTKLELIPPPPTPAFHHLFSLLLCAPFIFFAIACFPTTTFDKIQFPNKKGPSQINVIVPIRLKFKLFAVFIKWSSSTNFLVPARRGIVNYWNFPSKISRRCHRKSLSKVARHVWWEMFVKGLFVINWVVLQIMLEWLCLQPLSCKHYPTAFSESVLPTYFKLFWKSFYHQQPLQFLAQ